MRTSKICQYLVAPISIALLFLGMLLTTVQAQQGTSGAAVQPDAPSDISGRVTNSTGEPVGAIDVFLEQREGTYWRSLRKTATDVDGRFRFALLGSGIYRVLFQDPSLRYLATSFADGAEILLTGTSIDTIDVSLEKASVISGTILSGRDELWNSARVMLYHNDGDEWQLEKQDYLPQNVYSATYEFAGLAAGPYAVCVYASYYSEFAYGYSNEAAAEEIVIPPSDSSGGVRPASLTQYGVEQCYQNSGTGLDNATVLQAPKEGFLTNVDIRLETGTETGHITGIVTNQQGEAIEGIFVRLLQLIPNYAWRFAGGAHTNVDGQFSLRVQEAATYTLSFHDAAQNYVTEYLGDELWLRNDKSHFISPTMPLHDLDIKAWFKRQKKHVNK